MEIEGLTMSLRHVDESELIGLFGEEYNPFLSQYSRAQFQRIVVFELIMVNDSSEPFEVKASRCLFDYGDRRIAADNPFELINYWEVLDNDDRTSKKKEKIIKKYMLPDRETVEAGGRLTGYLVFRGSNLPRGGEGKVDIFETTGRRFTFVYNFVLTE
jgi:hypothetical protein